MIDIPRDDLVVMMETGYIYLSMGKYKEARDVFEGVSILAPKHDIPQVALSNVYFAQCKFLEAIRILKQALKENPKSAYAHAHLGESQLFYGKRDEAYANLNKAIELDSTGACSHFAKSLLKLMDEGYDPKVQREQFKKLSAQSKNSLESEAR